MTPLTTRPAATSRHGITRVASPVPCVDGGMLTDITSGRLAEPSR
ncbi:hypothetical protein ACFPRL_01590 [Pseudoclavibacter helvolus]